MKNYLKGFIAFTPVELAALALTACLSIFISGFAGGLRFTLVILACHLTWALIRYAYERLAWNEGKSEFGCPWQYRGPNLLLGIYYQERIVSGPRQGDKLHLLHYNPIQNQLRLI